MKVYYFFLSDCEVFLQGQNEHACTRRKGDKGGNLPLEDGEDDKDVCRCLERSLKNYFKGSLK